MQVGEGTIHGVELDVSGQLSALISCPAKLIPAPGQYVLAHKAIDDLQMLMTPLFPLRRTSNGFLSAPPVPESWHPGTSLVMRGPLGRGFKLPGNIRNLALLTLGNTPSRLLAILKLLKESAVAKALFTDLRLTSLPVEIEVHPLAAFSEFHSWADMTLADLPVQVLPDLRDIFGIRSLTELTCETQVLLTTDMPCGAIADCGACAVTARNGWKLVCKDGPVFNLTDLEL